MPARVPNLSARFFRVGIALILGLLLALCLPQVRQRIALGWGLYHEPAPVGADEARVRSLVLGEQPRELRFAGLFEYFAAGFVRHADPGYARVQYAGAGSRNGYRVDGLEGFARTGTLLAAWVYSGRSPLLGGSASAPPANIIEMLRSGLVKGADPQSGDYWGDFHDEDQRIVEAADIARIVWMTRDTVWNQLTVRERQRLRSWLLTAGNMSTPRTNWMLFPVFVNLTLASLPGEAEAPLLRQRAHTVFTEYRKLYRERGWFNDPPHGTDFYNTWGIPYELFWIHQVDASFETDFIVSALEQSALLTQYLIGPQGVPILGRSVCYRTAVPVPLLAANLLQPQKFPTGRAARALDVVWQYFVAHDALQDGALTQGYFTADLRLLDLYSGTGSCHWGLRSLLLALLHPPGDAFWQVAEEPLPVETGDYRLDLTSLGWVVEGHHDSGEITITVPDNTDEPNSIEPHTWRMRVEEFLLRKPVRPGNHEVKYESRQYSSALPYPLKN
jgi:hypothetical protein